MPVQIQAHVKDVPRNIKEYMFKVPVEVREVHIGERSTNLFDRWGIDREGYRRLVRRVSTLVYYAGIPMLPFREGDDITAVLGEFGEYADGFMNSGGEDLIVRKIIKNDGNYIIE